jgi:hypothetical protein
MFNVYEFRFSVTIGVRDSYSETAAPGNTVPPPKWQFLIDNSIFRFLGYKKRKHGISFARKVEKIQVFEV